MDMPNPTLVRRIGKTILAAGLVAAVLIYVTQGVGHGPGGYSPTKRDLYEIEQIGGKSTVLGVEFNSWFSSLWHGRRLAYTVGVLSVADFLVCLWLTDFFTDPPSPKGEP
jgi:hypothetical protein